MKKLILLIAIPLIPLLTKAEEYPAWVGLIGNFNYWIEDIRIPMSDIPGVYETDVNISGEFKFRVDESWEINYGGTTIIENEHSGTANIKRDGANFMIPGPEKLYHLTLNLNNKTFRWEESTYVPDKIFYKEGINGNWEPLAKLSGSNFMYSNESRFMESDVDLYLKVRNEAGEYYLSAENGGTLEGKHLLDEGDFNICNNESEAIPFHIAADSNQSRKFKIDLALQKLYSIRGYSQESLYNTIKNIRLQDLNGCYMDGWGCPYSSDRGYQDLPHPTLFHQILYPVYFYDDEYNVFHTYAFVGYCYLPENPKFRMVTDNLDDGSCFISPEGDGEIIYKERKQSGYGGINGDRYWSLNNWPAGLTKIMIEPLGGSKVIVWFEQINRDEQFTEWESVGAFEIDLSTTAAQRDFAYLSDRIEDAYSSHDKEITLSKDAWVWRRQCKNDPTRSQIMLDGFLGLANVIFDLDNDIYWGSIKGSKAIPIPVQRDLDYVHSAYFGLESLDMRYQPTNNIIRMDAWLSISCYDTNTSGYGSYLSFKRDKKEVADDFSLRQDGGGLTSDDEYISYSPTLMGDVDHLKYVWYYSEDEYHNSRDLFRKVVLDPSYATVTRDNVLVNFDKGAGGYVLYALAFNSKDEYLGIYRGYALTSNVRPEGDWESIGEGVWHHTWPLLWCDNSNISFTDDDLKWKVRVEKLKDPSKAVYRVVNPYTTQTPFHQKFIEWMEERYDEYGWYYDPERVWIDESDTYWFVFDATDLSNVKVFPRLTGTYYYTEYFSAVYPKFPKAVGQGSWDDKTFTISVTQNPYNYIIEFDNAARIYSIETDSEEEPEYYDIHGIKVSNPSNGIFIRRSGNKVEKIVK